MNDNSKYNVYNPTDDVLNLQQSVPAKQNKMEKTMDVMNQLESIGYSKSDVIKAMNDVSDRTNINEIIDYIDKHTATASISFKVRAKKKGQNALELRAYHSQSHKHGDEEHIDVDAIAFEDDDKNDDTEDDILGDMITPMGIVVDDDVCDVNGGKGKGKGKGKRTGTHLSVPNANGGKKRVHALSAIDMEPQNIDHYIYTEKEAALYSQKWAELTDNEDSKNEDDDNDNDMNDMMHRDKFSFNDDMEPTPFISCMSMMRSKVCKRRIILIIAIHLDNLYEQRLRRKMRKKTC